MFKKKYFVALMAKRNRRKVLRFSRLLLIVGFLWFLAFPFLSRVVFTSENAVRFNSSKSYMSEDPGLHPRFKTIQQEAN